MPSGSTDFIEDLYPATQWRVETRLQEMKLKKDTFIRRGYSVYSFTLNQTSVKRKFFKEIVTSLLFFPVFEVNRGRNSIVISRPY
jgi:hypothetical protein